MHKKIDLVLRSMTLAVGPDFKTLLEESDDGLEPDRELSPNKGISESHGFGQSQVTPRCMIFDMAKVDGQQHAAESGYQHDAACWTHPHFFCKPWRCRVNGTAVQVAIEDVPLLLVGEASLAYASTVVARDLLNSHFCKNT